MSITSGTKEQAVKIWQDKHREVLNFYPSIKKELTKVAFSKDDGTVMFRNGSRVTSLPINQASKGQRRHRGTIEESNIINHEDYEDIVAPVFVVPRQTAGGVVDPEELNGQVNRFTTSGYKNADEFNVVTKTCEKMKNLKGSFLFGATWRLPYRYGRLAKQAINSAREKDETAFRMNYLCEWVGSVEGALVSANKLMQTRTLKYNDLFDIKKKDKNVQDAEYVIAVDVAGTGFNTTSIVVGRVVKKENNKIDKVQIVNINTIPTSGDFSADAICIKKTFYAYGGDLDIVKSKVKAIVVDANAIGQGLVQELMENHYDTETNTNLGSFDLMFESKITKKPENKNSPKIIWDLMVQGKQNDIIVNFINMFNGGYVLMAATYEAIKKDVVDNLNKSSKKQYEISDFYKLNLPVSPDSIEYQANQVSGFINEMANLKTVVSEDNKSLKVKQIKKNINKDKFSAISYVLYYAKLYMDEEEKEEEYAVEDVVSIGFGGYKQDLCY